MAVGICPFCGWEGGLREWHTDHCRSCGNEAAWDEIGDMPTPLWESVGFVPSYTLSGQTKPRLFGEFYGKSREEPEDVRGSVEWVR